MIKNALKKGQLYVNYLGPSSALLGNLIATPILISNLGLGNWSLFALVNIFLPLVFLILFGNGEIVKRLMINIFLGNKKTKSSINMFYIYEQKIFVRFIPAAIILSLALIFFNSDNYVSLKSVELSFIFVSFAVFVKTFEFYYAEILNGLKQHYKLHIYGFINTVIKWATIIYLSFLSEININTLLVTVIIFSVLMLVVQRIFILNVFKNKNVEFNDQNNEIISKSKESNFGLIVLLILLLQQFDKVLVFGILDPLSLSYFGIAFMLSSAIPLILSPIIGYLTPEIYEKVEINSKKRKKNFSRLIIIQFVMLLILIIIVNLNLEKLLYLWLGKTINNIKILSYFIPLSIGALSISLLNSLKILFIAENKIEFMKKPLILIFCFFIFFTIILYLQILTVEIYLYFWSISMFISILYFYFIFFIKNIHNKK